MEGKNDITHSKELLDVVESDNLHDIFSHLFSEDDQAVPVTTFDYKWLRGVHRNAFTGVHLDSVYMSRGSQRLHTAWIPIGDTPPEQGVLAVAKKSHTLECFDKFRSTYGRLDIEAAMLDGSGWFTECPREMFALSSAAKFSDLWKTSYFQAGDIVIFGLSTAHMSTRNDTDEVRLSCDVRFQPAADPQDPRYTGERAKEKRIAAGMHHGKGYATNRDEKRVTMEELKAKWGFL